MLLAVFLLQKCDIFKQVYIRSIHIKLHYLHLHVTPYPKRMLVASNNLKSNNFCTGAFWLDWSQ